MSSPSLQSSELAKAFGGELVGPDVTIVRPCTLDNPQPNALGFIKVPDVAMAERLRAYPMSVFLVPVSARGLLTSPHILVPNPRAAFGRALQDYFVTKPSPRIAPTASIAVDAVIGREVVIGDFCIVGSGARIGDGTELRHHVVIGPRVRIGNRCLVRSNTVIGEEGFGIDRDEQGNNVRIPHLGSVVIGDEVEIGALNTVCAGTIDPTVVGSFVKTDDHVHIAHNCRIGDNSIITACAELSGSVTIGQDVWLGPNCSIMNGVTIGERTFIGLGSVVLKNCEPNGVYAGVPAERKRDRSTGRGTGA
jgi:UDP-3-O-[3-hydroxymyristoyl] glucosamine N-acyltransferase